MPQPFMLHINEHEMIYLPRLKSIIKGRAPIIGNIHPATNFFALVIEARKHNITRIATTSETVLPQLLDGRMSKKNDYRGSIIEKEGIEWLILPPLERLVTVNYGDFEMERFLSKFIDEGKWKKFPQFEWTLFQPEMASSLVASADTATFISVDIETTDEDSQERRITCVGFTLVWVAKSHVRQQTVVIPVDTEFNLAVVRSLCNSKPPKVTQNGKYDVSYFIRWNIGLHNWLCDTQHLFHSWYSELPKRLDYIAAFMMWKWQYWKHEVHDISTYYRYNAKDCYATAAIWWSLLQEVPNWAITNYIKEFQLVYPCLMAELRGLQRDNKEMEKEEARFDGILSTSLASIRTMVGNPNFNPSSPQQTFRLFQVLGCGDLGSTGKIPTDKAKARHPLNKRILSAIESYRKDKKLLGTYLRDKDPEDGLTSSWHGRIFYTLNPHGTDTGRLASKKSAFWCGWQIHNIPRDREDIQVKRGIRSDTGFYFGECDRSQAEVRDTAYIAGDKNLIMAVDDKTRDFHSLNAASFFGLSYSEICESIYNNNANEYIHRILDKPIRQLSKNTNHGSNYNMGANVMVDTMGVENVLRAQRLLKLPRNWTLKQVCQYLLDAYARTYPVVKGDYQKWIASQVLTTKLLIGATGWVRYCFGNPISNKRDMNKYVAHCGQSLNAMELNYAYMRVFREIALVETADFKLGPQIHDSILFQYRKGRVDLAFAVADCMNNPISVTDIFGVTRTLVVPTDLKGEAETWSEVKPLHRYMFSPVHQTESRQLLTTS